MRADDERQIPFSMPKMPHGCPKVPVPTPRVAVSTIILLSIPLIFLGMGRYGVVGSDEAFYQDIALGMLESGNFFELRSGASVYVYDTFANAPLQYWIRAGIASLLGKSMLSMRILSGISALLAVLGVYRLVLYLAGRSAAFAAALIFLTTFQFLYLHSARTGELEPSVCFFLVCSTYLFIRRVDDSNRGWWLHHLFIVLLFNLKAPTVFLPVAAELVCFGLIPRCRAGFGSWLRTGLLILPLGVLWHVFQMIHYPDQFEGVLAAVGHQAGGGFAMSPAGGMLGRGLYYAQKMLFGSFPHVLLYPLAIVAALGIGRGFREEEARRRDGIRIVLIYALTILVFYVGISKVGPWYIVHAYPFLAALVGIWLAKLSTRSGITIWGLLGISVVLSLVYWVEPRIWDYNPFGQDAYGIPMPTNWRAHRIVAPLPGAVLLAGAILGVLLLARRRFGELLSAALAAGLLALFIAYGLLRGLLPLAYADHLSPVAALHEDLRGRVAAGREIPFPVDVPRTHPWVVNYYFYRDFELRIPASEGRERYRRPVEHVLLGWKPGRKPTPGP
jgi:4-amino-4-deoxy-L-arabinose transferase-like glycosyltransferase